MTKCCPTFWSLKCRHGFGCMCIWFLHFTVQYSYKPLLMNEVVLCLQNPSPDDMKVKTAFAASQGNILQEQGSLLLSHLQLKTWETLALGWAIITVGSPRECDGDTPACPSWLWWAAMQRCSSTPSAISLLLGVATGARSKARQSSLGLLQLVSGRQRNAMISLLNLLLPWTLKRRNCSLDVWRSKRTSRSQTLSFQVDFTYLAYLPVLTVIALNLES